MASRFGSNWPALIQQLQAQQAGGTAVDPGMGGPPGGPPGMQLPQPIEMPNLPASAPMAPGPVQNRVMRPMTGGGLQAPPSMTSMPNPGGGPVSTATLGPPSGPPMDPRTIQAPGPQATSVTGALPPRLQAEVAAGRLTPEAAAARHQQFQAGQLPGQQPQVQAMSAQQAPQASLLSDMIDRVRNNPDAAIDPSSVSMPRPRVPPAAAGAAQAGMAGPPARPAKPPGQQPSATRLDLAPTAIGRVKPGKGGMMGGMVPGSGAGTKPVPAAPSPEGPEFDGMLGRLRQRGGLGTQRRPLEKR